MMRAIFGVGIGGFMLAVAACQPSGTDPVEAAAPLDRSAVKVIYLVRHAEKVTGAQAGDDPALTAEGQARADVLVDVLGDKGLTKIYSSPYVRTLDTAAPIAAQTGLSVIDYDPRDLPALKVRLLAECGVCLVVGHSNTTPDLAVLLGADGGTPIEEAGEYDRLYEIVITPSPSENGQNVTGKILRYGKAYGQ